MSESSPAPKPIQSAHNARYRGWLKLLAPKGVKREGKTLVCGPRLVDEALRDHADQVEAVIAGGEDMAFPERAPLPAQVVLPPELFRELDVFGTRRPLAVLRVPALPRWTPAEGFPAGVSVLVPFQDPENVGAVVRSAVAFGAAGVVLLREAAHPFHPKAVRSSAGAVFRVPLFTGPPVSDLVGVQGLMALSGEGAPLAGAAFPERCGLLAGLEGPGLPSELRAQAVAIPLAAGVESLNAAASVAVALYAWRRAKG